MSAITPAIRPAIGPAIRSAFEGGAPSLLSQVHALFRVPGTTGQWLDFQDTASLAQYSDASTPVTASDLSQYLGFARDKSGNGNHATQADNSKRALVGPQGMFCNGLGTINTAACFTPSMNNACTIFMRVTSGNSPDLRLFFGRSSPNLWAGVNGGTGFADLTSGLNGLGPGAGADMDSGGIVSLVAGVNSGGFSINSWWVQPNGFPKSAAVTKSRKAITGGLGFTAPSSLVIGGLSATSFIWPGYISEFLQINRAVSLSEQRLITQYMASRTGDTKPLVVLGGNSLTTGSDIPPLISVTGTNYPSRLFVSKGGDYHIRTDAYPGRRLQQMILESPAFSDLMMLGVGPKKYVVWEITNTLAQGATVLETLEYLEEFCKARRAAGFQVLVGTCLDRGDSGAGFNALRLAANAAVRTGFANYADGVIDFAAIPQLQDFNNATYFQADKTHLTPAGYQLIADLVAASL